MRSTRYKNEFDFVDVATEFELDLKEREFRCQFEFLGSRQPLTHNVFALYFSLGFETLSTEMLLTKLNI